MLMYSRFIKFLIILPILLHFNLFDLLHPAHNFNLRDNCPVCQFHSNQNNLEDDESGLEGFSYLVLIEKIVAEDNDRPSNTKTTNIFIRGPPEV